MESPYSNKPRAALDGVEALFFDVFGTVADLRGGVVQQLDEVASKYSIQSVDWNEFADAWRIQYGKITKRISVSADGPTNLDELLRQILDSLIDTRGSTWERIGSLWNDEERWNVTRFWHNISGWPDSVQGLSELKNRVMIAALSNGSVRLLVDMAKYAGFPWDMVFSTELFETYKPNPIVYDSAAKLLNLLPHKCAMVAAHISDLEAAKGQGYRTVYVRRPNEDFAVQNRDATTVKSKSEAGGYQYIDIVVNSLIELADVLKDLP